MLDLDVRTAAFTTAAVTAVAANGMFTLWWRDRRADLRDWTLGYALVALGNLLLCLRGHIPDLLSILAANLAMTGGALKLHEGTYRFVLRPRSRALDWVTLPLFGLVLAWFTWHEPNTAARVALAAGVAALLLGDVSRVLFAAATRQSWPAFALTGFSFGALALLQAARTAIALTQPMPADFMAAGTLHGLSFLALTLVNVSALIGFSTLHVQRLLAQLDQQARTDQLTGLLNRRSLEEAAQIEVDRAARQGAPLWVFMIDVDHFKLINDRFGHQEGDRVLEQVANALKNSLRAYDLIGRYGGEEFAVLLPGLSAGAALATAERLRAAVAAARADLSLTVSLGAAAVGLGERDWTSALTRADAALYEAKRAGRDRVAVKAPPTVVPDPEGEKPGARPLRVIGSE